VSARKQRRHSDWHKEVPATLLGKPAAWRGRPRNVDLPEIASEDDLIGAVAYQLIMWGYSARREAFAALAKAARVQLPLRVRGRQKHVGAARVEQIYEEWLQRHGIQSDRQRYGKEMLQKSSPRARLGESLPKTAKRLLARYHDRILEDDS
jgi:hypothetical protein